MTTTSIIYSSTSIFPPILEPDGLAFSRPFPADRVRKTIVLSKHVIVDVTSSVQPRCYFLLKLRWGQTVVYFHEALQGLASTETCFFVIVRHSIKKWTKFRYDVLNVLLLVAWKIGRHQCRPWKDYRSLLEWAYGVVGNSNPRPICNHPKRFRLGIYETPQSHTRHMRRLEDRADRVCIMANSLYLGQRSAPYFGQESRNE
jgi:hypothetical protein